MDGIVVARRVGISHRGTLREPQFLGAGTGRHILVMSRLGSAAALAWEAVQRMRDRRDSWRSVDAHLSDETDFKAPATVVGRAGEPPILRYTRRPRNVQARHDSRSRVSPTAQTCHIGEPV